MGGQTGFLSCVLGHLKRSGVCGYLDRQGDSDAGVNLLLPVGGGKVCPLVCV